MLPNQDSRVVRDELRTFRQGSCLSGISTAHRIGVVLEQHELSRRSIVLHPSRLLEQQFRPIPQTRSPMRPCPNHARRTKCEKQKTHLKGQARRLDRVGQYARGCPPDLTRGGFGLFKIRHNHPTSVTAIAPQRPRDSPFDHSSDHVAFERVVSYAIQRVPKRRTGDANPNLEQNSSRPFAKNSCTMQPNGDPPARGGGNCGRGGVILASRLMPDHGQGPPKTDDP